jgi:hypothetical protein
VRERTTWIGWSGRSVICTNRGAAAIADLRSLAEHECTVADRDQLEEIDMTTWNPMLQHAARNALLAHLTDQAMTLQEKTSRSLGQCLDDVATQTQFPAWESLKQALEASDSSEFIDLLSQLAGAFPLPPDARNALVDGMSWRFVNELSLGALERLVREGSLRIRFADLDSGEVGEWSFDILHWNDRSQGDLLTLGKFNGGAELFDYADECDEDEELAEPTDTRPPFTREAALEVIQQEMEVLPDRLGEIDRATLDAYLAASRHDS